MCVPWHSFSAWGTTVGLGYEAEASLSSRTLLTGSLAQCDVKQKLGACGASAQSRGKPERIVSCMRYDAAISTEIFSATPGELAVECQLTLHAANMANETGIALA